MSPEPRCRSVVSSAELLPPGRELGPSRSGPTSSASCVRPGSQLAMIDDLLEVARSDHRDARTCATLVDVGDVSLGISWNCAGGGSRTWTTELGGRAVTPAIAAWTPSSSVGVVANLLSNAVKYNRPHGRLSLRGRRGRPRRRSPSRWPTHGARNDPTDRFDPACGSPLNGWARRPVRSPGTGLGLLIVAHALDDWGARSEVEVIRRGFSLFRVFLPDPGDEERRRLRPEASLLLVDDHDAVRTMMDTLLRQVGGFHDIRHAQHLHPMRWPKVGEGPAVGGAAGPTSPGRARRDADRSGPGVCPGAFDPPGGRS